MFQGRDTLGPLCARTANQLQLNGLDLDVFANDQLHLASEEGSAGAGFTVLVAIVVEARKEDVGLGEENGASDSAARSDGLGQLGHDGVYT